MIDPYGGTELKERLARLASVVASIEAQQQNHPGYCEDIAASIAAGELQRLEHQTSRAEARYGRE